MLWVAAVLTADTRAGHQLALSDANIPIGAETAAAVCIEIFIEGTVHIEQVTSHVTCSGGALLKSTDYFLLLLYVCNHQVKRPKKAIVKWGPIKYSLRTKDYNPLWIFTSRRTRRQQVPGEGHTGHLAMMCHQLFVGQLAAVIKKNMKMLQTGGWPDLRK